MLSKLSKCPKCGKYLHMDEDTFDYYCSEDCDYYFIPDIMSKRYTDYEEDEK